MLYVTGIHALNLDCDLKTCGDWHTSAIQWEHPTIMESDGSFYGNYGIEKDRTIPEHSEKYNVANHIRALLDLIQVGNFSVAQGMRNDYICCEDYNNEIFSQVYKLKETDKWDKIDDFMSREYKRSWRIWKTESEKREYGYVISTPLSTADEYADYRRKHGYVISEFLRFLYENTDSYILKGGTALAMCYRIDRFSEDIELDGKGDAIFDLVNCYCKRNSYEHITEQNTDTVKRCRINYGGAKPLKVEVSCRRNAIAPTEYQKINGIIVYTIERLALMKCSAYSANDKMSDLYDLAFICCNYYDSLSEQTKGYIFDAILAKGIEQYEYLVNDRPDESINKEKLLDLFLTAIDKLGLLIDDNERKLIEEYKSDVRLKSTFQN